MALETEFNAFEILQIAERIERKNTEFYTKTAQLFDDSEKRDICLKLANWPSRHEKIWARMRHRFSEKTGEFGHFDPDNYVLSHPQVMAGLASFAAKPGSSTRLTGHESKEEIFKEAVRRANETIIFYRGLKDFARDPSAEDIIDKLIKEESRYIQLLTEESKNV